MQVKTVLNRVHKVKGFVYQNVRFSDSRRMTIEVVMRARRGSRPFCSGCGRRGKTYDRMATRSFSFVPLWALTVVMRYATRRVKCNDCGVKIELLPWANGKKRITNAHAIFLARWARRLSWKEVATVFKTSWDTVYRSVAWVVDYGLKHRDLDNVTAIGVDEVQFQKGHRYLTLVYQIERSCRRLLKRPENLTDKQGTKLNELMRYKLKSIRAYLLKDGFQAFWDHKSYHWAGRFLTGWIKRAMRSRLEPIKKVARSLRAHEHLILNWFAAKKEYSSGIVEGFNNKVKLTLRKAYGFRELEAAQIALYHALARLPEPKHDHRFC